MITEDYVSFETAKLLKEKGFVSDDCFAFYNDGSELKFAQTFGDIAEFDKDTSVVAPTLQMSMKWLREIFKLNIEVFTYWTKDKSAVYGNRVVRDNSVVKDAETAYNTYEQACESAIKWCLENVI